jgi:hypothetical protein
MIAFKCLWCGQEFKAPDNMAGKKVKCKSCASPIEVPRPGAAPAAIPRAAPIPPPAAAGFEADPFAGLAAAQASGGEYSRGGSTLPGMLVGLLGAVLLACGVFLPAVLVPDGPKLTFWQLGTGLVTVDNIKGELGDINVRNEQLSIVGAGLLLVAALAFLAALARSSGMLWFTALAALGTIGYPIVRMQILKRQAEKPQGEFCVGLAYDLLPQVRFQPMGWAIMGVGAVLLIVAAVLITMGRSRRRYMQ